MPPFISNTSNNTLFSDDDLIIAAMPFIKQFEGKPALKPFWDYAQYSIGYGSYAGTKKTGILINSITKEGAEKLLFDEIKKSHLYDINKLNINNNRKVVLLSYSYNAGRGRVIPVIDFIKKGNISAAAELLKSPTTANGNVLSGLVDRRKKEYNLFIS